MLGPRARPVPSHSTRVQALRRMRARWNHSGAAYGMSAAPRDPNGHEILAPEGQSEHIESHRGLALRSFAPLSGALCAGLKRTRVGTQMRAGCDFPLPLANEPLHVATTFSACATSRPVRRNFRSSRHATPCLGWFGKILPNDVSDAALRHTSVAADRACEYKNAKQATLEKNPYLRLSMCMSPTTRDLTGDE